jgi:hypothetical protein
MHNALLSCKTCGDLFRLKSALKNHVRREHQSLVKVKFKNGSAGEVKKGTDGAFKCQCGKTFKLPMSLQTHAKECNDQSIAIRRVEEEDVMMLEADVDDAESSCSEIRQDTPIDCFGAPIP